MQPTANRTFPIQPAADRTANIRGNGQLRTLFEKMPPHAIEAEACLLGSMIVEPQRIPDVKAMLRRDEFWSPKNGTIYAAIIEMFETHGSVDVVQLHQLLVDRDVLDAVGGQDYLVELANSMPSAANAKHYARLVREKAAVRGLLELAGNIFSRAHGTTSDPLSIIADAEAGLQEIIRQSVSEPKHLTLGDDILDPAELTAADTIPTGLEWFDRCMAAGALERGELVGFAAPPKVGKSALTLQLTLAALRHDDDLQAVWCLGEMTRRQLQTRAWVHLSGEPLRVLKRSDEELLPQQRAAKKLGGETLRSIGQRVHFVVAPFTPAAIEQKVLDRGAALVVVDYLQRLRPARPRDTLRESIDECMGELVRIAKQHSVAMLLISNQSKSVSGHVDMLTAFKESSTIGYDLDVGFHAELPDGDDDDQADRVQIKWRCLGNRNGPQRSFTTCFTRSTQTFSEVIG